MGEEQGLSAENRWLIEQLYRRDYGAVVDFCGAANLNALLNAARSEGLQPPVGEVEEEVFSSLGASRAPSSASAGVAETPSGGWQDIASAPKDALILLYGLLRPHPETVELHGGLDRPARVTGYWDEIDDAWSPVGSTWLGPWFEPTHWRPLPAPPTDCQTSGGEA